MIIRWAHKAQKQQDAVAEYIFEEFGVLALREFYHKIDEVEDELVKFPKTGKLEPLLAHRKKEYRSIVLTKKNKLIYSIDKDCICVHALWNTRREPKSQASELK